MRPKMERSVKTAVHNTVKMAVEFEIIAYDAVKLMLVKDALDRALSVLQNTEAPTRIDTVSRDKALSRFIDQSQQRREAMERDLRREARPTGTRT